MVSRWRILKRSLNLKPENCDVVVKACVVLHNFLLTKAETHESAYCPRSFADQILPNGQIINGLWRNEQNTVHGALSTPARNYSRHACTVRSQFKNYFNFAGAVSWQNEKAYIVEGDNEESGDAESDFE
jgi:hypothetical protein